MKACLIIPCYLKSKDDYRMLNDLIMSITQQTLPFSQIILIDDASPLPPQCDLDSIDYIHLSRNSGPAKARNHGIKMALENGYDYILFTDHDCILNKTWSSEMVFFMKINGFEAAGGLTLSAGFTILDRFHETNGTLNGRLILPEKKHLLYTPSCNFVISRKVAEEFEFDESYKNAAGEDLDYCLRVSSKYPIGFCSKALIWHNFGYINSITGLPRFIKMIKKYKVANSLLYQTHSEYFNRSWFESEPIDAGVIECHK